jgi:Holliday junction resolvase RusA-like endonuclease
MNMKKENIRNLIKKFDDIMTAASFAEEGEFETARKVVKEGKRVLLAVREGEVERNALTYA